MGLGKERREELREILRCGIGYSDVTVPPDELRALLESDEALERVKALQGELRNEAEQCDRLDDTQNTWGAALNHVAALIDRAISGDGGKEGK